MEEKKVAESHSGHNDAFQVIVVGSKLANQAAYDMDMICHNIASQALFSPSTSDATCSPFCCSGRTVSSKELLFCASERISDSPLLVDSSLKRCLAWVAVPE
jgi:hypothetical protein